MKGACAGPGGTPPSTASRQSGHSRRRWLARTAASIGLGMLATLAAPAVAATPSAYDPDPADPYRSLPWLDLRQAIAGAAPVAFDRRVEVLGPSFAEDPMNVPISVRVDPSLGMVERIVVVVDRNPIRRVLEYEPMQARPSLAFRFKLEQASPVRAVVRLADGRWVAGATWVDSAGGGCTVSGATRKDGSWAQTLGQVSARMFSRPQDDSLAGARLRLQVMHPMDTGLVGGIPAFYVSRLSLRDGQGAELARLAAFEPVSENPVFSFDFARPPAGGVHIVGSDNNGNRIRKRLP